MGSNANHSFSERPFWAALPGAWHPLCGSFSDMGWSFEWHDFEPATRVDWGKSFHPQGLEVCLNLSGTGRLTTKKGELEVRPESAALYLCGDAPVNAWREAGQRHQFLTAEFSVDFLRRNLPRGIGQVRPFVQRILDAKKPASAVDASQPLTPRLRLLVAALRSPPVSGAARTMWFTAKVYEVAAELFFDHTAEEALFCTRQNHVAQERVEKAAALVRTHFAEPLTLEELGQRVGCSPFYLSRTFTEQMGMTISQFLRQVRLERAAELLRSGKFNVTQAALEVGYSSVGHFSTAFHETFGCCPGLYPLQMPAQRADKE
ncbi:MAG: helix-turn-helix transcriptional regulator [Verrucomicrobia bacterium]|nr:helix-turn-helix transcriptional regulator [Verrucomicrobiota bacterium]